MLSGGHAENAASRHSSGELPYFPGHTPAEIMRELQLDNPELEWRVVGVPVTNPTSSFNTEVMDAIAASLEPIHGALPIVPDGPVPPTAPTGVRRAFPATALRGFSSTKDSFAHGLNERVRSVIVALLAAMIDELRRLKTNGH